MLTVGSLFSGIGGIDLGLERAGMKVIWQSEIDTYASNILAKHWPEVPNLGDITKIDWSHVERPDVVAGGFPCQPVSGAGAQRAQTDKRWLWPEFARCLRDLRPRYVLVENVPALLTVTSGRAAQEVFGDLASLGFDTEWECLPAAAFGAPHLRYRVFVVAYAHGERLSERPERNGQPGPGIETSQRDDTLGLRDPVADAIGSGLEVFQLEPALEELQAAQRSGDGRGHWDVEPDVGRVAHGIPSRVDRIRCLGNAVVPQISEYIGRRLSARIDGKADA
jgi:DNA (cytosine-5)-methyltransferase 1